MDRRHFLRTTAIGATAVAAGGIVKAAPSAYQTQCRLKTRGFVSEPPRRIPVVDSADVVVVGGGPAGFAAAVASARQGCDTLLLERGYFLGGLFTGCDVTLLNNMFTPTHSGPLQAVFGICDELCKRLIDNKMYTWVHTAPNVDTEGAKYFMEQMCAEAGVRILYGVQAAQLIMNRQREPRFEKTADADALHCKGFAERGDFIDSVILETKSGRVAVKARFVIDCTGDGDILDWAGEDFTEYKQDISAMWRVGNVATSSDTPPSDGLIGMVTPNEGVRTCHEGAGIRGVDGLDIYTLTDAQLQMRRRIWERTLKIRRQEGSRGAYMVSTPSLVGVRVTRVLDSVFNVTAEGAALGKSYDDVIGFTGSDSALEWGGRRIPSKERRMWQVPYRSLVPGHIENLLVAGRCFGFEKALTYDAREVGTCLMTGQAAGSAAALALNLRTCARDVDISRLQTILRSSGVKLDW